MDAPQPDPQLLQAIADARRAPVFLAALQALLDDVEAGLADLQAGCQACGACCRFADYGHRLYASTGELALLSLAGRGEPGGALLCRYQDGPLCRARSERPLGCRVYFCRNVPAGQDVYESAHERIRGLHAEHGIAYYYAEATSAMGIASRE